ncbi:DUF2250 domain-containing protein [Desulforamulus aeronauticus]|uniref:DUF2250 domain-containing protein n=1 Tax=Desulforamulus aeronauticus DSM 10349 TaxID=1121421 RepID=A0A1M6WJJ5_9FIRM|nr:DUF2250 domain-containing protein [Desulforamulus aeronauticus]SHK93796.1 Uncharacterized protein SAMN02745123_03651 [Desulforamulus aeronauticus DSM 10349]
MPVFPTKYLKDEDIWSIIQTIITERDDTQNLLAQPEICTDPSRLPELAKKLHELNEKCLLFQELQSLAQDLGELEDLLSKDNPEEEQEQLTMLFNETLQLAQEKAEPIYTMLMALGLLDIEIEDEMDLKILNFIEYAGPEYAWRLGINVGLDVEESRRRLEKLLEKGLLEKVQGTMLAGYHRQKDWVKHMNHTYYRVTREGRHYLRKLRRGLDDLTEQ